MAWAGGRDAGIGPGRGVAGCSAVLRWVELARCVARGRYLPVGMIRSISVLQGEAIERCQDGGQEAEEQAKAASRGESEASRGLL